jgi:hypothetical protein
MVSTPKIIVLTPVKNEAWILERFLQVTSIYADVIIIVDQNSDDGCKEIYPRYPKVHLLQYHTDEFDEAGRQILLIDEARRLFPNDKRILLALDADEMFAADALTHPAWNTMLTAKEGTVLYFDKLDLYKTPFQYIDYENIWPIGFVDDGSEHIPKKIHSIRIPVPDHADKLALYGLNILHYAKIDFKLRRSKARMYTVIQNVNQIDHILSRRYGYRQSEDWYVGGKIKDTPISWYEGYEKQEIDMTSIVFYTHYWQDRKVLEYFQQYGTKRFWKEEIWDADWVKIAQYFKMEVDIKRPPFWNALLWRTLSWAYRLYIKIK